MEQAEFDRLKSQARERVREMDGVDGWKDRNPGTIYAALEAGLLRPETEAQWDALVMLEDVYKETNR